MGNENKAREMVSNLSQLFVGKNFQGYKFHGANDGCKVFNHETMMVFYDHIIHQF